MGGRTTGRRMPEMNTVERPVVNAILDAALICHFGFVRDGYPVVIPTIHARIGDHIYVHGSVATGNLKDIRRGIDVCVTVTLVDGIVAARSLFNSSMNYRSVVVYGTASAVDDPEERTAALMAISDQLLPGRWEDARAPSHTEDLKTMILRISIDEASARVSAGPPEDEDEDLDLDVWAGVIPLRTVAGDPVGAPDLRPGIDVPHYLVDFEIDQSPPEE